MHAPHLTMQRIFSIVTGVAGRPQPRLRRLAPTQAGNGDAIPSGITTRGARAGVGFIHFVSMGPEETRWERNVPSGPSSGTRYRAFLGQLSQGLLPL